MRTSVLVFAAASAWLLTGPTSARAWLPDARASGFHVHPGHGAGPALQQAQSPQAPPAASPPPPPAPQAPQPSQTRDLFLATPQTYAPRFDRQIPLSEHPYFAPGAVGYVPVPYVWPYSLPDSLPHGYGQSKWRPGFPARRGPDYGYLAMQVEPSSAEVYVDGAYVGTAADLRAGWRLDPGLHHVAIRAQGYDGVAFTVRIQPGATTTYRRTLERVTARGVAERPSTAAGQAAGIQAPPPPKTFYVIRGCYAGDTRPDPTQLPASCKAKEVRVIPPRAPRPRAVFDRPRRCAKPCMLLARTAGADRRGRRHFRLSARSCMMPRRLRFSWPLWLAVLLMTVVAWTPLGSQAPTPVQSPAAQAQGSNRGTGPVGGGRGSGRAGRGVTPSALRSVPAETTAARVKDPNWKAPRLPWGHPDLEGTWTSDDMRGIPMSRPAQFGTRESLTPEEFFQRASGDEASRDRAVNQESFLRNEFGVRTFGYTSFIVDPPDGQMPPLTPAARARAEAQRGIGTFGTRPLDGFEDFTLYDRCITRGVPGSVMPVLYGNGLRIVQTPNEVVLTYEMIHDTRVIPLDGRPPLAPAIRQWIGDSRGRFDGDTLVVETANFTSRTSVGGAPHSEKLKLTEWFTRVDPEMIEYRFRVDDPDTFEAPFTARLMLTTQPGYYLYEYGCHEGNTAVRQGLSSERAYERAVEEARIKGLPIPPRANRGMEVYGAPDPALAVKDLNRER